eukprot:TRINITY_DN9436_c0_g1_i6.p1 TRINITY_DN9436_c0_g1~~TRINITY_DN9436_c0_g1_i6.p1  ORF type:complete len:352 (+),score=30.67 TRINITY_DN9436_c0_g1_i6:158-1213(+)
MSLLAVQYQTLQKAIAENPSRFYDYVWFDPNVRSHENLIYIDILKSRGILAKPFTEEAQAADYVNDSGMPTVLMSCGSKGLSFLKKIDGWRMKTEQSPVQNVERNVIGAVVFGMNPAHKQWTQEFIYPKAIFVDNFVDVCKEFLRLTEEGAPSIRGPLPLPQILVDEEATETLSKDKEKFECLLRLGTSFPAPTLERDNKPLLKIISGRHRVQMDDATIVILKSGSKKGMEELLNKKEQCYEIHIPDDQDSVSYILDLLMYFYLSKFVLIDDRKDDELDRALGCLVGALMGDAMGATLEFMSMIHDAFVDAAMKMEGGGTFTLAPGQGTDCLLYTSPSPRDGLLSRMPSSA